MAKYKGKLEFFAETGMEGGAWCLHDGRPVYEGLHILGNGDKLTIFNKDDESVVVWSGTINWNVYQSFTEHASGWWIKTDQIGVDRSVWAHWFFKEYPAELEEAGKDDLGR